MGSGAHHAPYPAQCSAVWAEHSGKRAACPNGCRQGLSWSMLAEIYFV